MDNFDPYNVFLSIATNIPVLLMTAFVLQGHIYCRKYFFTFFIQLSCSDRWMPLSILGISLHVISYYYYFYESVLENDWNIHCIRVFSTPNFHISLFWIRIKRQVMHTVGLGQYIDASRIEKWFSIDSEMFRMHRYSSGIASELSFEHQMRCVL